MHAEKIPGKNYVYLTCITQYSQLSVLTSTNKVEKMNSIQYLAYLCHFYIRKQTFPIMYPSSENMGLNHSTKYGLLSISPCIWDQIIEEL
jgi:hypothetical protein